MPLSPDHADRSTELSLQPRRPGSSHETARTEALRQAPGVPVVMLRPARVKVRATTGYALAYTVTHVLIERADNDGYGLSWEAAWLVRRLQEPK